MVQDVESRLPFLVGQIRGCLWLEESIPVKMGKCGFDSVSEGLAFRIVEPSSPPSRLIKISEAFDHRHEAIPFRNMGVYLAADQLRGEIPAEEPIFDGSPKSGHDVLGQLTGSKKIFSRLVGNQLDEVTKDGSQSFVQRCPNFI